MGVSKSKKSRVLVVIPARGGSKGIPLKNLRPVAGRSLVARAVDAALCAPSVTDVVVSTDHPGIRAEALRCGAQAVDRPAELSGDLATSESAVLHALDAHRTQAGEDPEVVVLLQCTSPFIDPADLDAAVTEVLAGGADVCFSVAESHAFLWTVGPDGRVAAVGHDAAHRPRRQDREPQYRETGAFYALRTEGFRRHGHRFFGQLRLHVVPPEHSVEIDSPEDLDLVTALAARREEAAPGGAGIDVDALVTDFDGVHTDDAVLLSEDGTEHVRVHRGDGMGVARLRRAGVPLLILSTEKNPVVAARGRKLGVEVLQGIDDKASRLAEWISARGLDPERVAFLGNDVNDVGAMATVGWPLAVADARPEARAAARLVLSAKGGHGAVREACERILAAQPQPRVLATAGEHH
ncbi:transferase [Zafaria cholistanensis]|uniref:N-acylneuraminate cytidylyltransferase n=1 Tax=Zafaria cholistanensis TaxID=1682741 RepID=A0A5A7NQL0_9MICC|nr:transferase [Zafaria cholistanensis]